MTHPIGNATIIHINPADKIASVWFPDASPAMIDIANAARARQAPISFAGAPVGKLNHLKKSARPTRPELHIVSATSPSTFTPIPTINPQTHPYIRYDHTLDDAY